MEANEVLFIAKNAVLMVFYLSMPIIVGATVVGLIVALIQTLIQLQEQTVAFAAKLCAVIGMFFLIGGSMANQLLLFLGDILTRIGGV